MMSFEIIKNKGTFLNRITTFLHSHSLSFVYLFILSFLMNACAVISAPTGGDKDKTAPKAIKIIPKNESVHFNSKEINIDFDEFIQLQNTQNILITPDINPKPIFTTNRKSLNIKFKTVLDSNTTYSIFFGNELKDYTEGNPTDNFTYVFSTGEYIDSLKIKGNILNYEEKLPQNTFVVLYKDLEDSAFTTKRPNYISRVQTDGTFEINHLKEGQYQIYALADNNSNYYYDLPTEAIGFLDENMQIDSNTQSIILPLFIPEESNFRIIEKDKSIQNGTFNITWNKYLSPKSDQFEIVSYPETKALTFFEDKKMQIYFTNLQTDTGNIQLFVKHNGNIIDSIETKLTNKKTSNIFFDSVQYKSIKLLQSNSLKLVASKISIVDIDTNKIYIIDTSKNIIPFSITQEVDFKTYNINGNFYPQNYTIVILDSCFQDLSGNYNSAQQISLSVLDNKKGGNLLININLDTIYLSLIFILKDNQGKVLKKEFLSNSQTFKINTGLIQAGEYKVEIIRDDNQNEIWNSGSFANKTLPEKIYYHLTPIIVKENWDAEETIQPNFNEVKIVTPNLENKTPASKLNELIKNNHNPSSPFQNRKVK